jgi:homocitrate synthase NifV
LRPVKQVLVEDTTLRDGEQAPGVALSADEKLEILLALDEAGVPMIEVGTPSMGGQEKEFITKAAELNLSATLVGWNRAVLDDLKCSVDCRLKAVHIGVPTSEIQREAGVGKGRGALYAQVTELIRWSKARGLFVSVSAEDSSRTPRDEILEYAQRVREAGADRIRLSDTLGLFTPFDYHDLVSAVIRKAEIAVQVHVHNDLGLAMGNVIAGVQAGATYVHATVNGWSERVGHPPLEVVAVALKRILGIDTGIDLARLPGLCALVACRFRRQIPPWQPVVGPDVFTHESGIHAAGTLSDERAFEPFPPSWVGRSHAIVAGKHSGSRAVQHLLQEAGLPVDRERASALLPALREQAIRLHRSLSAEELAELYLSWRGRTETADDLQADRADDAR